MKDLLNHYDKLLEILQKIINSQQGDISAVINELKESSESIENIKLQLSICQTLAEKQAEEISTLTKLKKRTKVLSYIELGVGIPCLVFGLLPIWNDSQKNIQNLFLGIGGTATTAGLFTFVFTIPF